MSAFSLDAMAPVGPSGRVWQVMPIAAAPREHALMRVAAFEHRDGGRCVEEFIVETDWPAWFAKLPRAAIDYLSNRKLLQWAKDPARRVATFTHAPHVPGEQLFLLGLNRYAHKPLGSFVWWTLRVPSYTVDWSETHTCIQIDRATGYLGCWAKAQEPWGSTARTLCVDVTGTPIERAWERPVFGYVRAGRLGSGTHPTFEPTEIAGCKATPAQLAEASPDLSPITADLKELSCLSL